MTQTNDYEKAEKRSFERYEASASRMPYSRPNEWLALKAGFKDGYQFGNENAQSANGIANERLRIAAMALPECINMVGRCGNQYQRAAELAVNYAEALLTELNKENND